MKRFYFLLIIICVLTGKIIAQNPLSTAVQIDTNYTPSTTFKSALVTTGNGSNAANVSANSVPAVDGTDIRIFPSSNPQSEVNISIDPTNSNNILVSAQTIWGNSLQGYYYSNDGGKTWHGSDHLPNSSYGRGDPCTAFDAEGNGYIVSMSPDGNNPPPPADGYYMLKTTDHGATWQKEVRGYGPVSGFDKEMIGVDNLPGSPFKNNFYCAWTEFTGTVTGYVKFNSLPAGSSTFSPAIILRGNNGLGQGVNVQTGPNGEVYVCWADYPGSLPATGIGFVKSLDGGETFSPASIAFSYSGIREMSGYDSRFNSRVNDFPTMAVDKSCGTHRGRIYIAYPSGGAGTSVIQVRYSDNQGETWSQPKTVSIYGATQSFFPWITVDDSTGIVCVVYYAFDTSVQYGTDTYLAYSSDGGATFNNIKVSDVSHITAPISGFGGGYAGDYIGVAAYGGKAYPIWMDDRNGTWQVYVSPIRFLLQSPTISGDSIVCTSGSVFTLNNPPSGSTVSWIHSSNLTYVSGQGTDNYTVKAASSTTSGMGWVKAVVSSSCGNDTIEKNVWVGKPATPTIICPYTKVGLNSLIEVNAVGPGAESYNWTVGGGTITSGQGTSDIWIMTSSHCQYDLTIRLTTSNACGSSAQTEKSIPFDCSGGITPLSVSPNPVNNILTVEINDNKAPDNLKYSNSNKILELRVYDKMMNLKMKKTFRGRKTQINVRNLNQGVYILQIISGNKIFKKEIMITHH